MNLSAPNFYIKRSLVSTSQLFGSAPKKSQSALAPLELAITDLEY